MATTTQLKVQLSYLKSPATCGATRSIWCITASDILHPLVPPNTIPVLGPHPNCQSTYTGDLTEH